MPGREGASAKENAKREQEGGSRSLLGGRCGPEARHILNGAPEQDYPPMDSNTVQSM